MRHILIGKTIKKIFLADDRKAIKFLFDNGGEEIARAWGECCSESWIEEIDDVRAISKIPVIDVYCAKFYDQKRSLRMLGGSRDDFMTIYGYVITTLLGRCSIGLRNESNGFYGGELIFRDHFYFDKLDPKDESSMSWIEVD